MVNTKKIVGINGFGRIGRAIFRIAKKNKNFEVAVLNDINPDKKNMAYQLKYDSIYGRLDEDIIADDEGINVNGTKVMVFHEKKIDDVPWDKYGVDIVIDSSGIFENVKLARNLKQKGVKRVVITHAPDESVLDRSVVLGVNEDEISDDDFIISSSICDANALAPVAKALDEAFGIDHGFITTIHPWLMYQNILDGPSASWSMPGHVFSHYPLGRASTFSILPKPTSTVKATCKVLKSLKGKFDSFSYRVPTAVVSSSDISVKLNKKVTVEDIKELFEKKEKEQKFKVIHNNYEPLVSIDFKGFEYAVIVDQRWTAVNDGNFVRMILWYDNEWGYSSKVVDLVSHLFSI